MKPKTTIRNCKFAFKCKANWDSMEPTDDMGHVRFCLDCQREVFFCQSDEELVHHVLNNRCIALIRNDHGKSHRLMGDVIIQ